MENAILLTKLYNYNDKSLELYKYYDEAINRTHSEVDDFNTCMNNLKTLVDKQYDFEWLTVNAQTFGVTRRDFRELCDSVCFIIGNAIEEICKYIKSPIIAAPSRLDEHCPFPTNDLVAYGNSNLERYQYIIVDGKSHRVVETKVEQTPYYRIYCINFD